jgi:hypothetical protein
VTLRLLPHLADAAEDGTLDAVALTRRRPPVRRTHLPRTPLDAACGRLLGRLQSATITALLLRDGDAPTELACDLERLGDEIAREIRDVISATGRAL